MSRIARAWNFFILVIAVSVWEIICLFALPVIVLRDEFKNRRKK